MYQEQSSGWVKHIDFIIFDMISMQAALFLAYFWKYKSLGMYQDDMYRGLSMVLILIDFLVILLSESFSGVLRRGKWQEALVVGKQTALVVIALLLYMFTLKNTEAYSRSILGMMAIFYFGLDWIVRILWKLIIRNSIRNNVKRSLVLVTTEACAEELIHDIQMRDYQQYQIQGVILSDCMECAYEKGSDIKKDTCKYMKNIPVVEQELISYLCSQWVDEVLIHLPEGQCMPEELISAIRQMGITVHYTLAFENNIEKMKCGVGKIGSIPVLTSSGMRMSYAGAVLKRSMDILGACIGCLLTVILTMILGPLIYFQSPGPIFFSQIRVGRNGKKFKIYKFRTMYMDAEQRKKELLKENRYKDNLMFKMEWDPRIIGSKVLPDGTKKKGIGNYIRDLSLDEFPQFFNVLKGDMSLVGTRPPTIDEWEKYEPWHRSRLMLKPGITGLWQVSGRSDIMKFEEVVRLDNEYAGQWSIGLDLKILLKTVEVVVKRRGSM